MLFAMENQEILIEKRGQAGIVTINRPAALNALNLTVLTGLRQALQDWQSDPDIRAVVLTGAGEKAFCAGGDLKHFHGAGQEYKRGEAPLMHPVSFFSLEYSLNSLIYHYPKPVVALMHGITMGGGYGVAGNSGIRVACETTVFAMPETKIGFFPDVGAMTHLTRAPANLGRYLAMTGNTLSGPEMTQAGLADIFTQKESLNNMLADIAAGGFEDRAGLAALLQKHAVTPSIPDDFPALLDFCAAHFRFTELSDIVTSLERSGEARAKAVLADLRARAPLSVAVALEHYNRSIGADFDEVIERDYQLCARFIQGHDLYEGIRALLIDKDKTPRWQHVSLEDVTPADVEPYFIPYVPPLHSVAL